jgi:hypothetical protein
MVKNPSGYFGIIDTFLALLITKNVVIFISTGNPVCRKTCADWKSLRHCLISTHPMFVYMSLCTSINEARSRAEMTRTGHFCLLPFDISHYTSTNEQFV